VLALGRTEGTRRRVFKVLNIKLTNVTNEGVILPQRTSGTWPAEHAGRIIQVASEFTTRKRTN
jgi:hypothetical protein